MSEDAHGATGGARADGEPAGQEFTRPATPLVGYGDTGAPVGGHSDTAHRRAWTMVALMLIVYFTVTITIYLFEPGLR